MLKQSAIVMKSVHYAWFGNGLIFMRFVAVSLRRLFCCCFVFIRYHTEKGMIAMLMFKKSNNQIQKNKKTSETNLRVFAFRDLDLLMADLGTTTAGLTANQVEERQEEYGRNVITGGRKNTALHRLREAVVNPFNIVLLVIAVITLFTDVIYSSQPDFLTVGIILSLVLLSSMVAFVQGERSNAAAENLSKLISNKADVWRDGQLIEIQIDEIVPGDIVRLSAGDMVPADVRFLSTKDTFVAQAALTGESNPVEKFSDIRSNPDDALTDLQNIGFMGSNIVSGSATAVVLATNNETYIGSMAKTLSGDRAKNSFERGVDSVSKLLIRLMLIMVPVVFLVNGITKGDWVGALMFSITIAVGLTPEMLPMIMTSTLAKGAVSMSHHKVIVKTLGAIQTFGEMDILCTDKTGTLTMDQVTLMYSLDVHGNQDERVLRHAFLNSYYQTGLRNLMDVAVLDYAAKHQEADEWKEYQKVDEIPFDFQRRRMSVVVADKTGKTQMITKGAIEEMITVCGYVEYQGQVAPITKELHDEIIAKVAEYNDDGMRVLGIAHKTDPSPAGAFSVDDEKDMVLLGYLAFLDPPKESTPGAIQALHEYGVDVKILTGDNELVTRAVCRKVGIKVDKILLGADVEGMDDKTLAECVTGVAVFAKLSPAQKARVVAALRSKGHTVGYMGDGINDAAAMRQADVAISVDSAVDIAKESANIILLDKDLTVLKAGIVEGRKTYANIIKYIKMTVSSNFGNMFSVLVASAFLPFLPMLPLQLLVLNLIYDISCIAIPWDNVDEEYLKIPRKWEAKSLSKFMLWMGPTSSVFDIATYLVLYFLIGPMVCGGAYHTLGADKQALFVMLFHTGWFVESLWTQTLVIHMIRTPKVPFIQSRASWQVGLFTSCGIVLGTCLQFTPFAGALGMTMLPWVYYPILLGTIMAYITLVTVVKKLYVRRYGELL